MVCSVPSAFSVSVSSTTLPKTIEARILIPKDFSGRSGVIVGNYSEDGKAIVNLEGDENGRIKLYVKNLTPNEKKILLEGCLINFYASNNK